jgi:hypothetical protein
VLPESASTKQLEIHKGRSLEELEDEEGVNLVLGIDCP